MLQNFPLNIYLKSKLFKNFILIAFVTISIKLTFNFTCFITIAFVLKYFFYTLYKIIVIINSCFNGAQCLMKPTIWIKPLHITQQSYKNVQYSLYYFRSPSTHKMSPSFRKIFLQFMPKLLIMRRTTYALPEYDDSTPPRGYMNDLDMQ